MTKREILDLEVTRLADLERKAYQAQLEPHERWLEASFRLVKKMNELAAELKREKETENNFGTTPEVRKP